ncbi:MAG: rhomboid family intramembrane serine protease [Nitrospinota bacterium]|nr:rhomboid family intramembrane serine protease [Nitrospinota bacterium]
MQYGPASPSLVWDRALYIHEPWRLLTGHFVHCGKAHILWNLPPFLFQGWLLERSGPRAWLYGVGAGIVGVDLFLALWPSAPIIYCGLSGLLNAMLVMNVFYLWVETGYHPLLLAALADFLKISAEIMNGGALFTNASWPSVPTAHAFGFVTASALVCVLLVWARFPGRARARGMEAG